MDRPKGDPPSSLAADAAVAREDQELHEKAVRERRSVPNTFDGFRQASTALLQP